MAVNTQTDSSPSRFLLILSILCALTVDIATLYSDYEVFGHCYFLVVGVVTNGFLYFFPNNIREWIEAFFKLNYGWIGTSVEDTVITLVASVLAVLRVHSFVGIIMQIGFYIQAIILNLILKPTSDLGLQTITSRVPILTAILLYGISMKAVLVVSLVVGLTFGRRYLESVTPVTVMAVEDETSDETSGN